VTPAETINFIVSVPDTFNNVTFSFGTINKLPEKLYEWGRYTATLPDTPNMDKS
jgi:hypothetical protein